MSKISLQEILKNELQSQLDFVKALHKERKKDVHIDDLWKFVSGCVKLGIPIKIMPAKSQLVTIILL